MRAKQETELEKSQNSNSAVDEWRKLSEVVNAENKEIHEAGSNVITLILTT